MAGGEEFIFSSGKKYCYTNAIRPAINTTYSPIHTNPFSKLSIERSSVEKYSGKLTRITTKNLSDFIDHIETNHEFLTCIMALLDAISSRSLLLIPALISVVLESLSKITVAQESGLERPIEDKSLFRSFLSELDGIIEKYSDAIGPQSVSKLRLRILAINDPINKKHLSNMQKLIRPFEELKISLSVNDIAAIKHRNDLMHGNILMGYVVLEETKEVDLYMAYIAGKLYTLVCKLILKYVGYEGYVYNHAKQYERHIGIDTKEEYFEKI